MKNNDKVYSEVVKKIFLLFDDKEVLEIGWGTGQFSIPLSKNTKNYIASDYSNEMINKFIKHENNTKLKML